MPKTDSIYSLAVEICAHGGGDPVQVAEILRPEIERLTREHQKALRAFYDLFGRLRLTMINEATLEECLDSGKAKIDLLYEAVAEVRNRVLEQTLKECEKERDAWKGDFNMYRSAWLREMGGYIVRKTYEIDGFVLRTQEIYEKARKWDEMQRRIDAKLHDPFYDVPDLEAERVLAGKEERNG